MISGGGSKGAFAGGVAQYLMQDLGKEYDMFLGTSTGSLLIPHLSLNKIDKIYNIFTNVQQDDIFSVSPFVQRKKGDREYVSIDFVNSLWQFIRLKRTFGESKALKRNIRRQFTEKEFHTIRATKDDVVVTVSNLSKNSVEYKSIKEDEERKAKALENEKKAKLKPLRAKDEATKARRKAISEEYGNRIKEIKEDIEAEYLTSKQNELHSYPIFMAIAESIGYDATGKVSAENDLADIETELARFIEAIENALDISAIKELLPLQPGDVPDTYANVEDLVSEFGYKPSTSVQEGIERFVKWYRTYYGIIHHTISCK